MAAVQNDPKRVRELTEIAQKRSCAVTEEDKAASNTMIKKAIGKVYYQEAYAAYDKAAHMPDGPARQKQWREAAALYKVALEKEPARDEAPEAAIFGALAYKQVGEYDQAIAMYQLFIKEYGNEENLNKLQKGSEGKPPDPKKYEERLKNLKLAYDTLAASYVLFFNYRSAAETYDTISRNQRFTEDDRRKAARNAVLLYANMGDKDKMVSSRGTFIALKPSAEQKADIDYLVATADMKTWDEKGSDDGVNHQARVKAIGSLESYFNANKGTPQASGYTVQAAYNVSKMLRAGRDVGKSLDWCKSTIQAFERYKQSAPQKGGHNEALGSVQADMAAECAFTAIDEKIKADFDYETNHHRYVGVVDQVKKKFEEDVKKAGDVYFKELQDVINRYESRPWSVAAVARQGSLYDSCRTGLYNSAPPGLKLYTDKEEKLLKMAETSDREDLQEQADALRQSRRVTWRDSRNRMLDDADAPMVKFYASAVVWSRAWKVRNSAVDHAIQRLAFFTDILGDAKIRALSQGIIDPETKRPFEYSDSFFLRSRPGASPPLEPNPVPNPLPVIP
jgi:outer membrane protein assembly factor BamD (BamD/ComL family)